MSKLRKQSSGFTQVPNKTLQRDDLTLSEKGLYSYILSKPSGWDFSSERIAKECKESSKTIKKTVARLEELGYIERTRLATGKISTDVFLKPQGRKVTVDQKPQGTIVTGTNCHGDKCSLLSNTEKDNNTKKESNTKKDSIPDWQKAAKPEYLDFCERYYFMLLDNGLTKKNTAWKTKGWYDPIRLLVDRDDIKLETLNLTLSFLLKNIKETYCPQVWSPKALREKWINLCQFMDKKGGGGKTGPVSHDDWVDF